MMAHRLKIKHGTLAGMALESWWRDIIVRLVNEIREENHGEFKSGLVEARLNEFLSRNGAKLKGGFVEFKTEEARIEFVLRYC